MDIKKPDKTPTPSPPVDQTDKQSVDKAPVRKKHRLHLSRKTWIIIGVSASVVLLAGIVVAIILIRHHHKKPAVVIKKIQVAAKPVTVPAPLTGLPVSTAAAAKPISAVIEENLYPDARPQSGLSAAGTVYEALAEGGITRYEAFYQEPFPADLGPVRSLRTYFAYWGREYNVPVAHAGGNMDALDLIGPLNMKNLDQFANGSYFRRISSRYSPHNLYIYGASLEKLLSDKGYATAPDFTPWPRKSDAKPTTPPTPPTASTITVNFSYNDYQVKFTYNPTKDNYTRYLRGVLDTDANGNTPITPKDVIVMYVPTSYGKTRIGEDTVIMGLIGTGHAQVFQDGKVTEGTWAKSSATARTTFTDTAGKAIALNRGQTWVCVIPTGNSVVFQ